jgi:hypothetical protein
MPTNYDSHVAVNTFISSLSFKDYVLIDCFKFNKIETSFVYYSRLYTLDFVALTEQGFLNIFDEISNTKDYKLALLDNQAIFYKQNLIFTIKYTTANIKDLINLPGLDFYKCYYDGIKIHSTPEAVQCHKTNEVQFVGKIKENPVINEYLSPYDHLEIKKEFEEINKTWVAPRGQRLESLVSEDEIMVCIWPVMYKVEIVKEDWYKNKAYEIIQECIFTNPVKSLC